MLAARIYQARTLRVENTRKPQIESDDHVLVKVAAAGICGSDLHVYRTGAYLTRTPITMGHEFSGQVTSTGSRVSDFHIGDHVVGDSRVWCGHCSHCQKGQFNFCESLGFLGEVCEGAFAEEIVVPSRNLVRINAAVPAHVAVLAEPLAVALHAVHRAEISRTGGRILILGAGPIGALISTVLRIQKIQDVTIVDTSACRREIVAAAGGDTRVLASPDGPYDLIFETTGSPEVVRNVIPRNLAKGRQVVMVGLFGRDTPFNFTDLVEHEWDFKGCACFDTELPEAVTLLERHRESFTHLVSCVPLTSAQNAFDQLLGPEKDALKTVLIPPAMDNPGAFQTANPAATPAGPHFT